MERIESLKCQLKNVQQNKTSNSEHSSSKNKVMHKVDFFKENGWGYKDIGFQMCSDGIIRLSGNRYSLCGKNLIHFRPWAENYLGLNLSNTSPPQNMIPIEQPNLNLEFVNAIQNHVFLLSQEDNQRIMHSHGQSLQEIYQLRYGRLAKCVDLVVFINSHEQAEFLVQQAVKHNVCLMPYGGGTNVTYALLCNTAETRMIVSVDTTFMNHIKWVDRKNMMACVESGIIGEALEKELSKFGVMCGHEPDSIEFSSVGGWIATRASGMKKNRYGNFEDIVINVKSVTPIGTLHKQQDCPRVSSGQDLNHIMLGSEGNLGLITEVIIKVRPLPEVRNYDSAIFSDFNTGIQFMQDVAFSKIWPASIRLVDNAQFQFGQVLKPENDTKMQDFIDKVKKFFVTKIKKYDPNQMAVCIFVFEGTKTQVEQDMDHIFKLVKKYQGLRAGEENGKRGYFLTYTIAYLRDFAIHYQYIAESFETSVQWKLLPALCKNVNQRILDECKKYNVKGMPFISQRVTQVYDTGAAVYIYFGFLTTGLDDPLKAYEAIEHAARDEIMKNQGCISHHHGVGKIRKEFIKDSIGEMGVKVLQSLKDKIDPMNIFGSNNTI